MALRPGFKCGLSTRVYILVLEELGWDHHDLPLDPGHRTVDDVRRRQEIVVREPVGEWRERPSQQSPQDDHGRVDVVVVGRTVRLRHVEQEHVDVPCGDHQRFDQVVNAWRRPRHVI